MPADNQITALDTTRNGLKLRRQSRRAQQRILAEEDRLELPKEGRVIEMDMSPTRILF